MMETKDKATKRAKIIEIVVGAIAFALTSYGVQHLFFKKDVASELKKAATEVNKQVPMNVDEQTRLDSAASAGKTNFSYYYTLFKLEKTEVNIDTVNKYVRPEIIENVKTRPELKYFRQNRITMDYNYFDKNGVFVTKISVTPDLYGE